MTKKIPALFLALVIALTWSLPACAEELVAPPQNISEEEKNAAVEEKRLMLEDKYGINITYDVDPDGRASIGTGSLATLDTALSSVTPQVVRQISAYWRKKTGSKITYAFLYSPFQSMDLAFEVLGSFESGTAVIEIYIPAYGSDISTTGDSPLTFVHELGHAYHQMFMDLYGDKKMRDQWLLLNGEADYGTDSHGESYDPDVFVSEYGATGYEEDFAEVFAHAFVRNRAGQGFSQNLMDGDDKTPLGKKVNYIVKMLPLYLTDTDDAVSNLRRVYTTPTYLDYNGVRFYGDYLQFIGCVYPRYVLKSLLSQMGLEAESNRWITELGGWQVTSVSGNNYIIFPGGTWKMLDSPIAAA